MFNFKDAIVLITGASSGIGRACAVKFGSGGGKVVVNYRADNKGATETVKLVEMVGGEVIALQGMFQRDKIVNNLWKRRSRALERLIF